MFLGFEDPGIDFESVLLIEQLQSLTQSKTLRTTDRMLAEFVARSVNALGFFLDVERLSLTAHPYGCPRIGELCVNLSKKLSSRHSLMEVQTKILAPATTASGVRFASGTLPRQETNPCSELFLRRSNLPFSSPGTGAVHPGAFSFRPEP